MHNSMKSSILVAALAALTLSTVTLKADDEQAGDHPADSPRAQRTVAYGDLNLASTSGQHALSRAAPGRSHNRESAFS